MKGIRVTATDLETGETSTTEIQDDYVLITTGNCHLDHVQAHGSGTHVLTVRGCKRARTAQDTRGGNAATTTSGGPQ